MFDYLVPGATPGRAEPVWSACPLQPLAAGVLTPFSYSVISELFSRGWFAYYDRLGFEPTPRTRVLRRHNGRAYLNLSISAAMDAERAGIEPVALRINQTATPLAASGKAGLLGGIRQGRARKRIDDLLQSMDAEMDAVTEKARTWYIKTQGVRWSQAEVLQVMEEIERVGVDSMAAYFAARHNLEWLYAQLIADLSQTHTVEQALLLINNALCDPRDLVEWDLANAIIDLSELLKEPEQVAWLKTGDGHDWQASLPGKQGNHRFAAFMDAYGHRALHEGELALPRWAEDPNIVLRGLLVCVEHPTRHPAQLPKSGALHKVVEALPAGARRAGEQMMEKVQALHRLQSRALHALAYIWAGTRRWALAAAHEAMADGRLHAEAEIFTFELEEIKEMMTGEWNISSIKEIHERSDKRRAQIALWRGTPPTDLYIGETLAQPEDRMEPSVILEPSLFFAGALRSRSNTSDAAPPSAA